MKKIFLYSVCFLALFGFADVNEARAAVIQTITATDASLLSGQVTTLKFTAPTGTSNPQVYLTCPAGVEAQVNAGLIPNAGCNTAFSIPNGTSAASQLNVVLVNKGTAVQTVKADFLLQFPNTLGSTNKSLNLTVSPFVVTNKTVAETATAVRYDFTMLPAASIYSTELLISCPAGITATYGTGASAVSLCNTPYAFAPALSYMDVVFRNDTDNPLSVTSQVSFSVNGLLGLAGSFFSKDLPAISVNSPVYANSSTFAIAKASVASMEVSLLNYSLTVPQGKERIRFACPEGVRGFKRNNNYSFVEVCNTDMVVPAGTASLNSQDVFFTNATPVNQTVTLSYVTTKSANPDDATWEKAAAAAKKDTIIVRPVLVPNKQVTKSSDPLRLTITKPAYPTAMKVDFLCPQGTSAKYNGVELCVTYPSTEGNYPDLTKSPITTGGQVFNTWTQPLLPAYIDVIVSNSHPSAPAYVSPRFSYTANTVGNPQYSLDSVAVSPNIAVQSAAYFDKTTVPSKGTVILNMSFPARTKGKVYLDCSLGLTTTFVGKCDRDFAYAALPTSVSFVLTNDADEPQTAVAKVCAYPSATSTTCSEFTASVEVGASPSVIDLLLGAISDLFTSWTPLFGDPTDKLIKTAVVKSSSESLVLAPPSATYAIVRAWGGAGGAFGNDNWSPQFALNNAKINFTPGGYGGFVAGKFPVKAGDYFAVKAGVGGGKGARGGDDNDRPGTPGSASSVSFNGKQVMVAGGGAQMLHTVAPTLTYITPVGPEGATVSARIEWWRKTYSSGGSQYAGVTTVPGVSASKRTEVIDIAKNSHRAPGMTVGGGGKVAGGWYVWPWFGNSYHAILTGGSSFIDPSVLNPTYFVGNPTRNTSDNQAWQKYFNKTVAVPAYEAGSGAVVVEFWGPADAPATCPDGTTTNFPDCPAPAPTLSLGASPTAITFGQPTTLSWSSTGVSTCSASSSVGAGLWSGAVTSTTSGAQSVTPSATGTMAYELSCAGAGGSILRTASVSVTDVGVTAPTLSLSASPNAITLGQPTTLSWSSTGVSTCSAVSSAGAGAWSGAVTSTTSGAQSVTPATTGAKTYELSCAGAGGSILRTASVNVTAGGCSNGATNPTACTTIEYPPGTLVCVNGATNPPLCTNVPDGLSITASAPALGFRFIGARPALSDLVTINVARNGFSGPVTVSVESLAVPAGISVEYSLGSKGSTLVTIPAGANSTTLRMKLSKKIPGSCEVVPVSGCTPYSLTLNATAESGTYTAQTSLRLDQNVLNPNFIEE
jgi:hypothetical protein